MAKLQRKTQKIFSLNAATNEHAVFGTMKNIVNNEQPQYSMDVEVLQSGTAFLLGWQNAVVAGFAPFLEEMNGVLYVITSQLAYLLNNGVAEYDENTTYYQGDIIKVVDNGIPVLKYSVIDDNTGNDTSDEDYWTDLLSSADLPIATTLTPGIVQPDGTTITITQQGVISAQVGANTDLSNLTDNGNAKFQYAPFSINNGTVGTDGNNATLVTGGSQPITLYYKRNVRANSSPVYDNGNLVSGSIWTNNASLPLPTEFHIRMKTPTSFKGGTFMTSTYSPWTISIESNGTMSFSSINENGSGVGTISSNALPANSEIDILMTINGAHNFNFKYKLINSDTYTDLFTWNAYSTAIGSQFTLYANPNIVQYIDLENTYMLNLWNAVISGTASDYDYLKIIATSSTLISNLCTITTADNRTKTFTMDNLLDCSSVVNGTYKVMKSYSDGSLSLVEALYISKTEPSKIKTWTQPVLISNGTLGGDNFAIEASSNSNDAYLAFDGDVSTGWSGNSDDTQLFTFYNPKPLNVTELKLNVTNVYAYSVEGSNNNSDWITLYNLPSGGSTGTITLTADLSSNTNYYKYHRITLRRGTRNDVIHVLNIDITAYVEPLEPLWLDTSSYPLTLRQYNGSEWITNNDLVYVGIVTVSNGIITEVSNNKFNKYGYNTVITETYVNGTSGYRVWSDGYCEQWGRITKSQTVVYLKKFKDKNYNLVFGNSTPTDWPSGIGLSEMGWYGSSGFTPTGFTGTADGNHTKDWFARGYLAEGEY